MHPFGSVVPHQNSWFSRFPEEKKKARTIWHFQILVHHEIYALHLFQAEPVWAFGGPVWVQLIVRLDRMNGGKGNEKRMSD